MEQFVTNVPFGTLHANIDMESDFIFWFSCLKLHFVFSNDERIGNCHAYPGDQDIPNTFFSLLYHSFHSCSCLSTRSSGAFSLVPVLFVRYLLRGVKGYLVFYLL